MQRNDTQAPVITSQRGMSGFADGFTNVSPRMSRAALIGAMPIVVAMILSGALSFGYNALLRESRSAVDHTFLVLSKIDTMVLRLQDAETGQRGFIITGEDSYLAPFVAAEAQVTGELSDLEGLVSDNAVQILRIESLEQLTAAKFSELNETIATRRNAGVEAARLSVLRSSGKDLMDQIRSLTAEMRSKERGLLEVRLSNLHWAEGLMLLVAAISVALSLGGRMLAVAVRARINPRLMP